MRKNFGAKPCTYPQPVFIIATYSEDGTVDVAKLAPIVFAPVNSAYHKPGEKVGNAFQDGVTLK